MLQMNTGGLYGVLRNFYVLTGNRIGIMDKDFREIMSYPVEHGGFCALVHKELDGVKSVLYFASAAPSYIKFPWITWAAPFRNTCAASGSTTPRKCWKIQTKQ